MIYWAKKWAATLTLIEVVERLSVGRFIKENSVIAPYIVKNVHILYFIMVHIMQNVVIF